MALKAVCIAGIVLFLFAGRRRGFLKVMGISIDAFRIAGGIMLFLIALEMVFRARVRHARDPPTRRTRAASARTSPSFRSPFRSSQGPARSRSCS
jgi:multiple antibiotic resistance protein